MIPNENKLIKIAETLARKAHTGQYRWDGKTPYITHPEAVANSYYPKNNLPIYVATAWLHDVIEDTPIGWLPLFESGLPAAVIMAVWALTKEENENYLEYILRVKQNAIATKVKMRDISHNLHDLGDKQKQRKEKYLCALHILEH